MGVPSVLISPSTLDAELFVIRGTGDGRAQSQSGEVGVEGAGVQGVHDGVGTDGGEQFRGECGDYQCVLSSLFLLCSNRTDLSLSFIPLLRSPFFLRLSLHSHLRSLLLHSTATVELALHFMGVNGGGGVG